MINFNHNNVLLVYMSTMTKHNNYYYYYYYYSCIRLILAGNVAENETVTQYND